MPVVLGSATPSLESLHNVQLGRYRALRAAAPRRPGAPLPRLALIDLRRARVHAGLAGPAPLQAIERHLASDGQVLVYLNRRGYAPTLFCTSCGWIAPCTRMRRAPDRAPRGRAAALPLLRRRAAAARALPGAAASPCAGRARAPSASSRDAGRDRSRARRSCALDRDTARGRGELADAARRARSTARRACSSARRW